MAKYVLTLYKIFNKETNRLSDFIDDEGLNDFLMHLNYKHLDIKDFEIYKLEMPCVTQEIIPTYNR